MPTSTATMTVEAAARHLGIGRALAYELARRGDLPGVLRLGRRLIVSRAALEQALGLAQVPTTAASDTTANPSA